MRSARRLTSASLLVLNKADLLPAPLQALAGHQLIAVSALTGAGVADLLAALKARAAGLLASGDQPVLTRLRHRRRWRIAARLCAGGWRSVRSS